MELDITKRTKIQRVSNRANYDLNTICQIIDEAYICQVGFADENGVHVIPTAHWRHQNKLYIHGATKSRMIKTLLNSSASINITLVDGLVLAKSAFHHSMNYRSVNIYARATEIVEDKDKILQYFIEKITAERAKDIRHPNKQELKATTVLAFPIEEAVAKIRTGPPVDDKEDMTLTVWSGVIPLRLEKGEGISI